MLKKTLLISGSRFALALCAGFALTGVDAASAQMASSNAGCLINVTSSVLGAVTTAGAGVSAASGFNATSVACAGVAYALTSPLQPTISSPQPEAAGHGVMVGGSMYDHATGTIMGAPQSNIGGSPSSLGHPILVVDAVSRTADGGLIAGFRGESPACRTTA
jgi:hypothetical protein